MANDRLIPHESSTGTVTLFLKVNGTRVDPVIEVLSITVEREVNRIPYAKIIIKDGDASAEDFILSNEDVFLPGNEIEVLAGYDANEDVLFKGVIVKHGISIRGSSAVLKLDCRDKTFITTLSPKNRYFVEVSDTEAFEEILSEYDLSVQLEDTSVSHKELVQFESTDWDFIIKRALANGHFCIANDGELSIAPPVLDGESVLTLQFGATMLEFDAEIDARQQYANVIGLSWDYTNQEIIELEGAEPGVQGGGNLGASALTDVGNASLRLRHSGQVVQEELQAWADAELLIMRLKKVRGRVKFEGYGGVQVGNWVTLQGVGERFNGLVYVSGIRHEVHNGKWNTHIQFGLPKERWQNIRFYQTKTTGGIISPIQGLQIGVVSQLEEDPDGENRILVNLPIINPDEEGIWARVATLDAGENRGVFFLPEVGDEVIVGFVNDDPRDPVVLGMLHSSAKAAPITASDDNFEKGIITKNELKLLFNDEKNTLQLETPAGKKIVLDEDKGVLSMEDENNNKITLDSSGIKLESGGDMILKANGSLSLEGVNVALKANANFKAEGAAGAELSTSAIAVLKGSLVKIN